MPSMLGGTPTLYDIVEDYFQREHLSPTEVGKLDAAGGAKTAVAAHIALERDELAGARKRIAAGFKGRIEIAQHAQAF